MTSSHTHTEQPPAAAPTGARAKIAKAAAAVVAVIALAFGANAVTNGGSSSATASGTQGGQTAPGRSGTGGPPGGMGTAVTGATLTKLKAVATAKYPGTVERAMKLSDGSYEVHVIQAGGKGEVHVLVSKAFKVTGTQKGGPPGGAPPAGSNAPSGTAPSSQS